MNASFPKYDPSSRIIVKQVQGFCDDEKVPVDVLVPGEDWEIERFALALRRACGKKLKKYSESHGVYLTPPKIEPVRFANGRVAKARVLVSGHDLNDPFTYRVSTSKRRYDENGKEITNPLFGGAIPKEGASRDWLLRSLFECCEWLPPPRQDPDELEALGDRPRLHGHFRYCKSILCPRCQRKRARKMLRALRKSKVIKDTENGVLITLKLPEFNSRKITFEHVLAAVRATEQKMPELRQTIKKDLVKLGVLDSVDALDATSIEAVAAVVYGIILIHRHFVINGTKGDAETRAVIEAVTRAYRDLLIRLGIVDKDYDVSTLVDCKDFKAENGGALKAFEYVFKDEVEVYIDRLDKAG